MKKKSKSIGQGKPESGEDTSIIMVKPYIFKIKNLSFDYVKDFSLNNLHQALGSGTKFDTRVRVECESLDYTYEKFLGFIEHVPPKIALVRIEAIHKYSKHQAEQLREPVEVIQRKSSKFDKEKF